MTLATMRVPKLRDLFFSRGERAAHLMPIDLTWQQPKDDFHHGAMALTMSFELPRGSYATMLVKRLQAAAGSPDTLEDLEEDETESPTTHVEGA
jgi:tRNA pseudouridine13 synthase